MQRKGIASALLCLLLFSILFLTRHTYASPPNCHCQDHDRVLRLESPPLTGQDVEELQTILRKLGYYDDAIDGVYNERTEKAVMDWQVWAGLPANGIFGSQEQEALTISIAHESIKTPSPAPPSGEMRIEIDVEKKTLTLLVEDQIFQVYPCAVGKSKTKTPIGEWRIIQKGTNWGGGFGTRWLGLNVPWGIYGIHGTNNPSSIGTEASAGCIRMHNKDVEQIYPWITVGTRVSILGPFPRIRINHPLQSGQSSKQVQMLQLTLREAGFNPGYTDGRYGPDTAAAVQRLQEHFGLRPTGKADNNVLLLLNLR